MALETDQRPKLPKGQFFQIFLFMAILFVLFDENLRTFLGDMIGIVLNPMIGFDGEFPILTILLASLIMITATTFIRHYLVDWVKTARIQNTMRAYQKALREARVARDTKRIEQLTKFQPKLMGMQAELSSSQLKPMAGTMIVVIPIFAWLWAFVLELDYRFFTAPWNPTVDMFDATVFPHWILFYTAISIPFGTLLQKLLKYYTWKEHWHLARHNGAAHTAEAHN